MGSFFSLASDILVFQWSADIKQQGALHNINVLEAMGNHIIEQRSQLLVPLYIIFMQNNYFIVCKVTSRIITVIKFKFPVMCEL